MDLFNLFIGYFLFGFTYFIAVFMFCSKDMHSEKFYPKLAFFSVGYILFCIAVAAAAYFTDTVWLDYLIYSLTAILVALFALFTSKESKPRLLYNVLAAMLVRNAASKIINCILFFTPLDSDIGRTLISSVFIIASYLPVYMLFAKKIAADIEFRPVASELVFISVLMMLLLPAAYLEPAVSAVNAGAYVYLIVIEVTLCYGILGFQYIIHVHAVQKAAIARENELNKRRLDQYASFSGVIEVMNCKIHDLKHQIRHFGKKHNVSENVIRELEQTAAEYGAFVKTGNDVLDTILTEKNFVCIANKISAKFMIDGGAFGFLSVEDTVALFGNLLDNAAEYLVKIDDEQKRFLRVASSRTERFMKLSVENYCESVVEFDSNGFPLTDKSDKSAHGFGTKSVAKIAEKYAGITSYRLEDGMFKAQIIFPTDMPNP